MLTFKNSKGLDSKAESYFDISFGFLNCQFSIVSAGKHLSNTNLSDLSIVGTRDIFVYR